LENNNAIKLQIGHSISHRNYSKGTIGAFVKDEKQRICLLSCNHVLAQNGELVDLSIPETSIEVYHPGNSRDSLGTRDGHVANVVGYLPLNADGNQSDSAYASILDNIPYSGNVIPDGFPFAGQPIYQQPRDFVLQPGTVIYKIGSNTQFTSGKFARFEKGIRIRQHKFDHVIKVIWSSFDEPFSLMEDSGSLAFVNDNGTLYAIGMVFAGFNKMGDIEKLRKLDVLPYSYLCSLNYTLKANDLEY
jgi:hypothetical protein